MPNAIENDQPSITLTGMIEKLGSVPVRAGAPQSGSRITADGQVVWFADSRVQPTLVEVNFGGNGHG